MDPATDVDLKIHKEIERVLAKLNDERYEREHDIVDLFQEITALRDTINTLANQIAERLP